MDDAVRAAMARWPDVPDVHGWLKLDARGNFRLRVPGTEPPRFEAIANPALLAFIARNYGADLSGRWHFQNGPQRVYVELEATPWIMRLAPDGRVTTHTGGIVTAEAVFRDENAVPVLVTPSGPGLLDDRDLAVFVDLLVDATGSAPDDTALETWLDDPGQQTLFLRTAGRDLPIGTLTREELPVRFGYVMRPAPG